MTKRDPIKTRDFRSDTMTLPTAQMRDAMRDAVVGDDVVKRRRNGVWH